MVTSNPSNSSKMTGNYNNESSTSTIITHSNPSDSHKKNSASSQIHQIFAGAVSGACTRFITQPFDVLKVRFQLQVEPFRENARSLKPPGTSPEIKLPLSKYTSLSQAIRLIYREEGLLAFWKGHNAGQLMSMTYSIAQFWSYEQLRLEASQMEIFQHHVHVLNFLSGGLAGCVGTVFSMPFDVIRTRVIAQDPGAGYSSLMRAFPEIWRSEGIPGFFRGLGTTLIQIGPMVGFNFMFYKKFNEFAKNMLHDDGHGLIPTWCLLLNGGAAGVASKAVVYPLDFIKKRLQMRGFEDQRRTFGGNQGCRGIKDCIDLTLRNEGFRGFYKGMSPTLLKSGLTTALYFCIYDKFRLLLEMPS